MQEFIENIGRYFRFFITFSLGVFFALFGWLQPLLKNRVAVLAFAGILLSAFAFIAFTLRAMLGLASA